MIKQARDFDFTITAISADSDWGKCVKSFLSQIYRKSGSLNTQHHYCAILEHFMSITPLKPPPMKARSDVESFITMPSTAAERPGPVKSATINGRLTCISSFYHYAASYGVQGDDGHMYPLFKYLSPTAGVQRAQKTIAPYKALSPSELKAFFAAIPRSDEQGKRDYALFSCYFLLSRPRAT